MQQKSLKVSLAVYDELKAYADARGGLPLGRAIENLLDAERRRRFRAGVQTQVPEEQYRREATEIVGVVDVGESVSSRPETNEPAEPHSTRRQNDPSRGIGTSPDRLVEQAHSILSTLTAPRR